MHIVTNLLVVTALQWFSCRKFRAAGINSALFSTVRQEHEALGKDMPYDKYILFVFYVLFDIIRLSI